MIRKVGNRFPACAKPSQLVVRSFNASAGEARSEKIMLKRSTWTLIRFNRIGSRSGQARACQPPAVRGRDRAIMAETGALLEIRRVGWSFIDQDCVEVFRDLLGKV
jgi:hypothetical protein